METKVPGGRIGIAPHSLRAVTLDDLAWAAATWRGQPAHIHVSEQTREVDDCLAAHGRRPIDLLMDTVEVDEHWCLVHATHADEGERARIARAKAVVGLCPITEANLGDGLFDVPDFLGHGGRFGVGSDSNVRISAADELRTLEYGQRLIHRQRNVLGDAGQSTGRRLFDAALAGGAQAVGRDRRRGRHPRHRRSSAATPSSTTGCSPPTTPRSSRSSAAACGWSSMAGTATATASPRATARRSPACSPEPAGLPTTAIRRGRVPLQAGQRFPAFLPNCPHPRPLRAKRATRPAHRAEWKELRKWDCGHGDATLHQRASQTPITGNGRRDLPSLIRGVSATPLTKRTLVIPLLSPMLIHEPASTSRKLRSFISEYSTRLSVLSGSASWRGSSKWLGEKISVRPASRPMP